MFDEFVQLDLIDDSPIRIPKALEAAFVADATSVKVKKGQTFLSKSDETTNIYLIRRGLIEFTLFSASARETLFRECGPGQIVGELAAIDESPRSMNAVALEDSEVLSMSRHSFRVLIDQNSEFRDWMLKLMAGRIRELSQRILNLSTLTVPCRVWLELIQRCEELGRDRGSVTLLNFPVHRRLAAKLGTHREAISREFSKLTNEGIVKQNGRELEICSVDRLRELTIRHLGT